MAIELFFALVRIQNWRQLVPRISFDPAPESERGSAAGQYRYFAMTTVNCLNAPWTRRESHNGLSGC